MEYLFGGLRIKTIKKEIVVTQINDISLQSEGKFS